MSVLMFLVVIVVVPVGLNLALWKLAVTFNRVKVSAFGREYAPFLSINAYLFGPSDGGFIHTILQMGVYIALYVGAYVIMGLSLTGHVSAILTDLVFMAVTKRFMCYTGE